MTIINFNGITFRITLFRLFSIMFPLVPSLKITRMTIMRMKFFKLFSCCYNTLKLKCHAYIGNLACEAGFSEICI